MVELNPIIYERTRSTLNYFLNKKTAARDTIISAAKEIGLDLEKLPTGTDYSSRVNIDAELFKKLRELQARVKYSIPSAVKDELNRIEESISKPYVTYSPNVGHSVYYPDGTQICTNYGRYPNVDGSKITYDSKGKVLAKESASNFVNCWDTPFGVIKSNGILPETHYNYTDNTAETILTDRLSGNLVGKLKYNLGGHKPGDRFEFCGDTAIVTEIKDERPVWEIS